MRKLKELYNPELKNEYIEKSNSPVNSRQLLRKTSDFERLFDRDLCQFTFEQYDALLKNTSYDFVFIFDIFSPIHFTHP